MKQSALVVSKSKLWIGGAAIALVSMVLGAFVASSGALSYASAYLNRSEQQDLSQYCYNVHYGTCMGTGKYTSTGCAVYAAMSC